MNTRMTVLIVVKTCDPIHPRIVPYTVEITWNSTGLSVTDLLRQVHAVVQSVFVKCLHKWLWAIVGPFFSPHSEN